MDSLGNNPPKHPGQDNLDRLISGVRTRYKGLPFTPDIGTTWARGRELQHVLETKILPSGIQPSICIVGVGYDNLEHTQCPFTPYKAAALLESHGADYDLTLVDINGEIFDDIQRRNNIIVPRQRNPEGREQSLDGMLRQYYPQMAIYLSRLGVKPTFQQSEHPDITFKKYASEEIRREMLARGFLLLPIPPRFKDKRDAREIKYVKGDIALADLPQEAFGVVDMMHVLAYLDNDGKLLALYNISHSLKPGGYALFNLEKHLARELRNRINFLQFGLAEEQWQGPTEHPDLEVVMVRKV